MSKENLSNESSEEVVKNATDSNTKRPDIPPKSETSKWPRVLKNDKWLKAFRIGRTGAAVLTVGANAVYSPVKAVESAGKLFAPVDNLSAGGVIKEKGVAPPNLIDKGLDKLLKPIPGGATISKAIQKTYKTIGTRPVSLGIKLAGIAVSLAFPVASIPVALAVAGVSLAAIAYNVGKETLEVRDEKRLNAEKKSLENIKEAKQTQHKLLEIKAQEIAGKGSPDLENFLAHKGGEMYRRPSEEPPEKPFTNTYFKEFTKVCRDSVPGFVSTLAGAAASANPVVWVAAGTTMAANFLGETDNKLVRMEQKRDTINQINELKAFAPDYTDPKKLPELERQEKINTKALEEFVQPDNIKKFEGLNAEEIQHIFEQNKKEIADRREFEAPAERTNYEKVKSGVKEWAGYIADSQLGDLKALYGKDKEKTQDVKPSTPTTKAELDKAKSTEVAKEKVKGQARHMQESLTQGQVSMKASISTPLTTPILLFIKTNLNLYNEVQEVQVDGNKIL